MQTGNDETGGARSPTLADFIRSTDRKHRPKVAAVRGSLPQHAPREIEQVRLARLTASKTNARTHSPKQLRQLADCIQRFGFTVPILVNTQNEIAGHGRVEAARLLGLTEVPVLRVSHLSPVEQRAYVIADNRLAELAGWDRDALAIELQGLSELDFDIEVTGFELGEIDLILRHDEEDEDGTEKTGTEAKTAKSRCGPAVSREGDVWLLGAHQLTCGEADDDGYAAVDAAIRRWQKSTGISATLGSGQTFKAIAQKRRKERRATGPAAVAPSSEMG